MSDHLRTSLEADDEGHLADHEQIHTHLAGLEPGESVKDTIDNATRSPACKLRATSSQTIPSGAFTTLEVDTADYDTGMGDLAQDRLVIQEDGIYILKAGIRATVDQAADRVQVALRVDDGSDRTVAIQERPPISGSNTGIVVAADEALNEGDAVYAVVFQNSGSDASVNPSGSFPAVFLSAVMIRRPA